MPRVGARDDAHVAHAAEADGEAQGERVARGYGLRDVTIDVDTQNFGPGGWVTANGTYTVSLDVPVMRELFSTDGRPGLRIRSHHQERIDRFRSLSP
jgi:hypothetical protein